MTDEELDVAIVKHNRRRKVFEDAGLSVDDAFDLAEKLLTRDEDPQDDRRLCFECKRYDVKNGTCPKIVDRKGKPQIPARFILQRCDWIQLKGKK